MARLAHGLLDPEALRDLGGHGLAVRGASGGPHMSVSDRAAVVEYSRPTHPRRLPDCLSSQIWSSPGRPWLKSPTKLKYTRAAKSANMNCFWKCFRRRSRCSCARAPPRFSSRRRPARCSVLRSPRSWQCRGSYMRSLEQPRAYPLDFIPVILLPPYAHTQGERGQVMRGRR